MARQAICKTGDVPEKGIRQFEVGALKVCVVNAGDRFFACQASCPHEGMALCDGVFDGGVLTCLEHLWQWSLPAGGEPRGLAECALQMFPVQIEDGVVYVSVETA